MRKTVISAAAIAFVGAGAFALAQTQGPPGGANLTAPISEDISLAPMAGMSVSAEDRAVLLDARIGAIKTALKLTPDQEKLWGPVDAMIRKRAAFRNARMRDHMRSVDDGKPRAFDPIARMRARADRMTKRARMMHEFADAAQPLYASLGADQKRRVFLLMHRARGADVMGRRHDGRHGRRHWHD